MGLDMYLNVVSEEFDTDEEIYTWRKFNALQNYMEINFGKGTDINCKDIELGREDVRNLLSILIQVSDDHSLAEKLFPNTTGFFYGSQEYDESYFDEVDRSIETFRTALKESSGHKIIYSCWY